MLLTVFGCEEETETKCLLPIASLSSKSDLIAVSSETVTIGETTIDLHAYVAIDSGFEVYNCFTLTYIVDVASIIISDNILMAEEYVIKGDSIWFASFTEQRIETEPY